MDRRLFVTGLLGVAGTAGIATILPGRAQALTAVPLGGPASQSDAILPKFSEFDGPSEEVDDGWELDDGEELDDGFELASYHGGGGGGGHPRRRRRRRMRRWRRICRREWYHGYWRRRCRRRPFWIWLWL